MFDVRRITDLHQETVRLWHRQDIDNPHDDFLYLVCEQHKWNFLLWHEEDIARSPDVGDARVAQVKRNIDRYNQLRNDGIEKLDDYLLAEIEHRGITPAPDARLNTETPGSATDRLSILALRLYHMQEQAERPDASEEHRIKAADRLAILCQQHHDLSHCLAELLLDILIGKKRLKLYRQFKMYNDPTLNPYLYRRPKQAG
jgi:hypothetical protein